MLFAHQGVAFKWVLPLRPYQKYDTIICNTFFYKTFTLVCYSVEPDK